MRPFILSFLLSLCFCVNAQNWNAFNKSYRYNYIYDHDQLITNVLFADSVEQSGSDTVYYMNRIGVECQGTCPTITTAITNTEVVIVPNMPQFLQRTIIKKSDETLMFSDTSSWLFKPKCVLNEVWIFDAANSKTAQCVSISTISIFNIVDSLRTIIIDGTDSLLLSKQFGIIQFPNVYGKNKYYRLVGIENVATYEMNSLFGLKVPNAWDFYNFDVGDKFCNSYYKFFVAGSSNSHWTDNKEKVSIISKTVVATGYQYVINSKKQTHYYGYSPQYNNYNFKDTTIVISYTCNTGKFENTMYPGQIINVCNVCTWAEDFNNIVKFGKDNNGKFYKYAGPNCIGYTNVTLPNYTVTPYSYSYGPVLTPNAGVRIFAKVFGVGLGVVSDRYEWGAGSEERYCLTCAFKNGNLYLGTESDVSVQELSIKNSIRIYPNPVDEWLTITFKENLVDKVEIVNLLGEVVVSRQIVSGISQDFDFSVLTQGVYILEIYNQGKIVDVIKVIKN